jgi:leukotriene-A4 hydrolase
MCCCLIQYELKPKDAVMGSALHIPLPADLKLGSSISVKVTYKTTKDCTALQWLEKEYVRQIEIGVGHDLEVDLFRQTQGKTFPYLFSQCQPIYARALAPLQGNHLYIIWCITTAHIAADTPSVKIVRVMDSMSV